MLDDAGQVILEARGLRLQALKANAEPDSARTSTTGCTRCWRELDSPSQEEVPAYEGEGSWLVFADEGGFWRGLRELLVERGERCVVVSPGEAYRERGGRLYELRAASPQDFERLFADALGPEQPPLRGVVHLWSLDAAQSEGATLDALESSALMGCIGGLHLIQARRGGSAKFPDSGCDTRVPGRGGPRAGGCRSGAALGFWEGRLHQPPGTPLHEDRPRSRDGARGDARFRELWSEGRRTKWRCAKTRACAAAGTVRAGGHGEAEDYLHSRTLPARGAEARHFGCARAAGDRAQEARAREARSGPRPA